MGCVKVVKMRRNNKPSENGAQHHAKRHPSMVSLVEMQSIIHSENVVPETLFMTFSYRKMVLFVSNKHCILLRYLEFGKLEICSSLLFLPHYTNMHMQKGNIVHFGKCTNRFRSNVASMISDMSNIKVIQ